MTTYYSASARGFFDDALHSELPADAVAITGEEHAALLQAQSAGMAIAPGTDGRPALVAAPPPPPPAVITMRQARLALLEAGLLGQVDAAIASLPSPQKETGQIEWEYASEIWRESPVMMLLGAALGLSEAEIGNLFIAAAAK